MSSTSTPRVAGLFVYPVKSCRGLALDEVALTRRGFAYDREWMVTDAAGDFLTQREEPRLALVVPKLLPGRLELRAPGRDGLEVRLEPTGRRIEREVTVWDFSGPALDEGEAAAAWFSAFLGRPARLVRWRPETRRLSSPDWTRGVEAENRFTDGYPILVLSEASLADLNARRAPLAPLPMNRFRPNLVVSGVPAYAEDSHATLRAGDVELRLVKPSERCRITTTDQQTAEVSGDDPLRTLAKYRRDPRLNGVVFGQNAVITRGFNAALRVGTPVELRA